MKISLSNLFNYFSVSGDSKQIKNFPQKKWYFDTTRGWGVGHFVVGTTQKSTTFFDAAPYIYGSIKTNQSRKPNDTHTISRIFVIGETSQAKSLCARA